MRIEIQMRSRRLRILAAAVTAVLASAAFAADPAKDTPKGRLLPELRHDREIRRHPEWLAKQALRPAYSHFEWDERNTPQAWAKIVREAGANCLVAGEMPAGMSGDQIHILPSSMLDDPQFKWPAGYRQNDHSWVKDFVDAGHSEGLKVVIYDGAFRTLDPLLVAHPEWRQMNADGTPYATKGRRGGFGSWNSPYRDAYIERWVKVAREHGIDGIMVDMLFTCPHGGDYSPFTVRAFKAKFGVEPPRKEDRRDLSWQRWIDFQTWTREEVMLDLTEALHAVDPQIACIWNQTVGWVFNGKEYLSSRAGKCADGLLEEMGWEVRQHGVFKHRPSAWPIQGAWQSLFLHCRTTPGYGQMWHYNGHYTRVNHEALSYCMFANGVAPAVVAGGNWKHLERVWAHIKACEAHMSGARLVPYAALHFSEDTLQWYANAGGDELRFAYLMSVYGIFQAMLETHLPVAIITDDDLRNADALKRYAAVILPNSACLSAEQAAALEAYVSAGGGLVAGFESGVFDENGTRRESPVLASLMGVKQGSATGGKSWFLHFEQTHQIANTPEITSGGEPSQGLRDGKPYICLYWDTPRRKARIVKTTALPGTESIPLTRPARWVDGGPPVATAPLAGRSPEYCVLHTRKVGGGRTVYFPPDIGHAYFIYNHPITRLLIERAVRWAAGTGSPLETDAPMAVQTVYFANGNDVIVHLLNDISSFGRAAAPNPENFGGFRDEVLPVHDVTVTVAGTFGRALLLPEGKELPVVNADERTQAKVPKVGIHAMVVFSP